MDLSTAVHDVLQSQQNGGNVRFCQFPKTAITACINKALDMCEGLLSYKPHTALGPAAALHSDHPVAFSCLKKRASGVSPNRFS